jgi:carbonic anhydrase
VPEIIFDQGLGELFVIRLAGNIVDDAVLASVEYSVAHLGVGTIVVMGHESCGAIAAAIANEGSGHFPALAERLSPAVEKSCDCTSAERPARASKVNAECMAQVIEESGPLLKSKVLSGELKVHAAYYNLESGVVEFLA